MARWLWGLLYASLGRQECREVLVRLLAYGSPTVLSPNRGDPLKAQGAQPCKGDQTLGRIQPMKTKPYRGDPGNRCGQHRAASPPLFLLRVAPVVL